MLIVLSPAKKLDYKNPSPVKTYTLPDYLDRSQQLINELQKLSADEIGRMMKLSKNLANLNKERYMEWQKPGSPDEPDSKQAAYAFRGDVFQGWQPETLREEDMLFAQDHVRILSGLYGMLRPLDLMKPYRLEMGTKFGINAKKDLYEFWQDTITEGLNTKLEENEASYLINLASNEYFKAIDQSKINAEIITPVFKDNKNGEYRVVSFYAKKARGMMTRFVLQNRISDPEQLKLFEDEGYYYNDKLSEGNTLVFTRG
ncbi:MAG: peroxide stress protein YaaA [Bacteroidales bacterium]|nr:peroxide stress protein YaaA [Bacteroidales bacterium]MCF8332953.1 peroxide stress protein YaaA [Bacteroidales bacterium]